MDKTLITIKEFAELLSVSSEWITEAIENGHVPKPLKIGDIERWNLNKVQRWIDSGCPKVGLNSNQLEGQYSRSFCDNDTTSDIETLEEAEKKHIMKVLNYTGDNRAQTATILKIGERTLYRKIKEYGL